MQKSLLALDRNLGRYHEPLLLLSVSLAWGKNADLNSIVINNSICIHSIHVQLSSHVKDRAGATGMGLTSAFFSIASSLSGFVGLFLDGR